MDDKEKSRKKPGLIVDVVGEVIPDPAAPKHVFISYVWENQEQVDKLCQTWDLMASKSGLTATV